MVDPIPPTREELQRVARGDERTLRALERLFQVAGDLTPQELQEISIASGSAAALAETAIGVVRALQNSLGTMAFQDDDNVEITGGTIAEVDISESNGDLMTITDSDWTGGSITNTGLSFSSINFSTFVGGSVNSTVSDDTANLIRSTTTLNNGAGAAAGTLTNAPTAGNPTKWVPINDNGTIRYIPTWT